jgi:hypothetical protein
LKKRFFYISILAPGLRASDRLRVRDIEVAGLRVSFFGAYIRAYVIRSDIGGPMPQSVSELEQQRATVLQQIFELGDFRPGCISGTGGRCGKPGCHCHRPKDPGHTPHPRLTYKMNRKTLTESFASPAAQRKAEREIDAFRRWQQLSRSFVEINEKICRLRPVEETLTPQEKKRRRRSSRKSRGK